MPRNCQNKPIDTITNFVQLFENSTNGIDQMKMRFIFGAWERIDHQNFVQELR